MNNLKANSKIVLKILYKIMTSLTKNWKMKVILTLNLIPKS